MNSARAIAAALAVLASLSAAPAQEPRTGTNTAKLALPPVREIAPGILQIGDVRLDRAARAVSFPAAVNMTNGPLEYLVVTATGKTHESLLKTRIAPYHLHVAMLLLGAKGSQLNPTNAPATGPLTAVSLAKFRDRPLPGEAVTVEVSWKSGEKEIRRRLEELVLNTKTKQPMTRGDFTFTGSVIWQGNYVAQQEGSILAAATDTSAIFNNPRPGRDVDDTWAVLTKETPPFETPVTVTIKLIPTPKTD